MLQPGPEVIANEGGLQNFTQWRGPMMTDSGGYQIFSLGHGSVSEEIKSKNKNIPTKIRIQIVLKVLEKNKDMIITFISFLKMLITEITKIWKTQ